MRGRLLGAGVKKEVRVIPPCADVPREPTLEAMRAVRAKLDLGDAPIVLYPGDYEVSRGAATVARAVHAIVREKPTARVVFACRSKTPRAAAARTAIEAELRAGGLLDRARLAGDIDDMHALVKASSVVAFPVDDLYGKVDIPLVLLEALALGVPIVAARGGPLEAIATARFVEPDDDDALASETTRFLTNPRVAADAAAAGRVLHSARFTPKAVAAAHDDLYDDVLAAPPDSAVVDRSPPP
jgi:phosphatidylinositol alpha-1,6-mannosyltransferase